MAPTPDILSPAPAALTAPLRSGLMAPLPGLWLVAVVTAAAYGLRGFPGVAVFSPMILAILAGAGLGNLVALPATVQPGLQLAGKGLLRGAVALLGLQVTLGDLAALGLPGIGRAALALGATFAVVLGLGRLLGVARPLVLLIAAGTSVCGAAAIAGANGVVRARDGDVAYAVAAITLWGTLAMLGLPLAAQALGLDAAGYGAWVGLSVHEVAQVVGAGFQGGEAAGRMAVVVKLARVLLLAPLVMGLALALRRGGAGQAAGQGGTPPMVPRFILAFLALSALQSAGLVPEALRQALIALTPVLLTAALAALGLGTRGADLRRLGWRPLVLCGLASGFLALLALILATA